MTHIKNRILSLALTSVLLLGRMKPYLDNARSVFKNRRDLICKRINEIDGIRIEPPKGAFYAFPAYSQDISSQDLANELARAGLHL